MDAAETITTIPKKEAQKPILTVPSKNPSIPTFPENLLFFKKVEKKHTSTTFNVQGFVDTIFFNGVFPMAKLVSVEVTCRRSGGMSKQGRELLAMGVLQEMDRAFRSTKWISSTQKKGKKKLEKKAGVS